MYPLFKNGEEVEMKKVKTLKRNNFVVIDFLGNNILKKIVGIPNDIFEIYGDSLFINKTFICHLKQNSVLYDFLREFNGVLPDDNYIVIGEDENSIDSRIFGPVLRNSILGKV